MTSERSSRVVLYCPLVSPRGYSFLSKWGGSGNKQIGNMIVIRLQRLGGKSRDGFPLGV